jgi:hypothetical protein
MAALDDERKSQSRKGGALMNMWVRRQILALWGCFSNASHQVRQQMLTLWERFSSALHWVRQQIPTLREWYYNTSDINQLIVISATLFMLILPLYLFVPMPPMGAIFTGIFFGTGIVRILLANLFSPSQANLSA